jgi:hypothetical protein
VAVLAGTFVQQIVAADDFRIWIGKKSEGVAGLLAEIFRDFGASTLIAKGLTPAALNDARFSWIPCNSELQKGHQ